MLLIYQEKNTIKMEAILVMVDRDAQGCQNLFFFLVIVIILAIAGGVVAFTI